MHHAYIDVLFRILKAVVDADLVIASTKPLADYFSPLIPT